MPSITKQDNFIPKSKICKPTNPPTNPFLEKKKRINNNITTEPL